ncbi:hypothetical protein [Pantoea deleyi]|uniref:hypothetical protein n=1 Tax=Pantoea deleyi TaxID=470932 RepID=UPI001F59C014|nr:hypothetical protein [Pantoea deleyi]
MESDTQKAPLNMIVMPPRCSLQQKYREDRMDDESVDDAIAACRLLFGQAVLEILAEDKPLTRDAISENIERMFNGIPSEPVMKLAISLLTKSSD